ncbi:MAG TPA: fibronectin type III domain-containing protein, partial [Terriglobia bacterium]|nr:fibronectin type III domain-containing protein [Terriglobia bacterium]
STFSAAEFWDTKTLTCAEVVVDPAAQPVDSGTACTAAPTASPASALKFGGHIDDLIPPTACASPAALKNYTAWLQVGDALQKATLQAVCPNGIIVVPNGTAASKAASATLETPAGKLLTLQSKPDTQQPFTFVGDLREELGLPAGHPRGAVQGQGQQPPGAPCADPNDASKFQAWLQFGTSLAEAKVQAVCPESIMIVATNPPSPRPDAAVVKTPKGTVLTLPYQAPVINKVQRMAFFAEKLRPFTDVCGDTCNAVTDLSKIEAALLPPDGVKDTRLLSLDDETAVVEFTAPIDYQASALMLTNRSLAKSVIVRSLPGGQAVVGQANVSFNVVDPDTVKHNFGSSISGRYVVVDLTVRNPGTKKIQLKKSAVWFEADYVTAKDQGPREQSLLSEMNLKEWNIYGATPACLSVPSESSITGAGGNSKGARPCHVYRYGLEHTFRHVAEDYFSVLGTYDDVAGLKQAVFDIFDVAVAVATGLNGSIVTGKSYADWTSLVSGIVEPRTKGILLNQETQKRLRSQLLQQSFGDIIQIPSQSSVTTKVFLPRRIIDSQFGEWVVIRQLRNVHLDLEVVSEAVSEAVAKGEVHLGMTEDEVVQSLGVPNNTKTDAKTAEVTWSYDQGAYQSVEFSQDQNKQFKVSGFVQRLAAPTVTAEGGKGEVTLSWDKIEGATSCSVYRGEKPGQEGKSAIKEGITATSYTDTGLKGGTYYYYVTAVNSEGESLPSKEVKATAADGSSSGGGGATHSGSTAGTSSGQQPQAPSNKPAAPAPAPKSTKHPKKPSG